MQAGEETAEFESVPGSYAESSDPAQTSDSAEMDEMELAAELLEVTDEAGLDQFLGNLIRNVGRAAGRTISAPAGRALGSLLKGAARKALPMLGAALGRHVGGASGARLGSQLASNAGHLFGLELEGLSPEDAEFEVARRYSRFARGAVQRAVRTPPRIPPSAAATAAVASAAQQYAPGLLAGTNAQPDHAGQWVRRGRNVIIVNC